MSAAEAVVGVWQLVLALAGAGVAVAQMRSLKRVPAKMSLSAWHASGTQFASFVGIAIFGLVAVGLFCATITRDFFPKLNENGGFLHLIPLTQTLSLVFILLAAKFLPQAFPPKFDGENPEKFRRIFSAKSLFGAPAFFAVGFSAAFAATLLVTAALPFLPESVREIFKENQVLVNALLNAENPWLAALCVPAIAIFTPIIEEIIFRAGLYRFLKSKMRAVPAAVLSSVVFALMHDAPISYLPLTLLGCVFCFAYEKTGRLITPICIHALFNANTLLCVFAI